MTIPIATEAAAAIRRALSGFEPAPTDDPGFAAVFGRPCHRIRVERERLPIPALPQLALIALGANNLGRFEKLAWEYPFRVDGVPCSLALQKFGLRLYIDASTVPDEHAASALGARTVGSLISAQRLVERLILKPTASQQIALGNVTISNQFAKLQMTYEYFRTGAELAYAGDGRFPRTSPGGGTYIFREQMEGWWNTFAMVVSYFSLLEHVLVGCLPFSDFDPGRESITAFIGARWAEKFKRLFDLSDPNAMRSFNELRDISESYRNPYSHGGFDKAGAALAIHTPGIGAIPAILSDLRDSPHFEFLPVAASDFQLICQTFDRINNWLESGAYANGVQWVRAGMDIRLDGEFRREVRDHAQDFDAYLNRMGSWAEQAMNMDW